MNTLRKELRDVLVRSIDNATPDEVLKIVGSLIGAERAAVVEIRAHHDTRFVEIEPGQILDNETSLIWSKENVAGGRVSWADAKAACEKLNVNGVTGWRLPTIKELFSLVDHERSEPAIDPIFKCESAWYWSATPYASSPSVYAWYVGFSYGGAGYSSQGLAGFVRAVRASQS